MSLPVFILRLAAVQALKGETLAGDQIFDAPLEPLEDAIGASKPVVAVFSGVASGKIEGRDLLGGELTSELVFQIYLPEGVEVSSGGRVLRLDTRGSGAELALEILSRQIIRTLLSSPNPWAELWRRFVPSIENAQQQPFALFHGTGSNAVKVAAREITLDVQPIMEPPIGQALPELWTQAFALMRTVPGLEDVADWLEIEASTPADLPTWRQAQAALGLSLPGVRGIGLGGPSSADDAPGDPVETVNFDGRAIDAAAIDAQFPEEPA